MGSCLHISFKWVIVVDINKKLNPSLSTFPCGFLKEERKIFIALLIREALPWSRSLSDLIGVNHSYRCSRIVCITSITMKAHFIWFVFSNIFITVGAFIFDVARKITKQYMCVVHKFRWMKYDVYTKKSHRDVYQNWHGPILSIFLAYWLVCVPVCLCMCVNVINDAHMIVLKYHRTAYISSMQYIPPDPDDYSSAKYHSMRATFAMKL